MGIFSSKKKKQVIGYRYYIGMHMIAGHGNMDACEKIKAGEKIVWTDSNVLKDSYTTVVTSHVSTYKGRLGMTFTPTSSYTLTSVGLPVWRNWNYFPGTCVVEIRATDGSGLPIGDVLSRGTFDGDSIIEQPASLALVPYTEVDLDDPIILTNGTKYTLIVYASRAASNWVNWNANVSDVYTGGRIVSSIDGGLTWANYHQNRDLCFKLYKLDGHAPNSQITISNDSIFGGDKKEGGISGAVDFEFGAADQIQNDYLVARHDSDIPAFRGLWGAVLRQVYIGTSSYLRPWSFLCKRVCKQIDGTDQWYKEKAVIRPREDDGDDLNAAHIIRECLIAPEWGLGWAAADIDDNSFKEAANILYNENFGLSMLWDQVEPMEDFVDEILNYIAGILYQDLSTGKWILSLTRDKDYSTAYNGNSIGDDSTEERNLWFAQTFTTERSYSADSARIKIRENIESNTFNVRVELQGVDANHQPDGIVLAHSTIQNSQLSTTAAWISCPFTSPVELAVNTEYALIVYKLSGSGSPEWRYDSLSEHDGYYMTSNDNGSTWSAPELYLQRTFMFEIYAGGELETYNESEIIVVEDFSRPAYGEIVTTVTVKFWDKLNHKTRSTEDRDIALIEKQGGYEIEKILNYQGICNADLANSVAARELKFETSMLAGIRLSCTRAMSHLEPNDVFLFSWGDLGITQMALRVLNANYGSLHKNRVVFTCVEDEFGAAATIYGAVPDTLSVDPVSDAIDVDNRIIIEIPYWSLVNDIINSKDLVDALDSDFTRMAIVAGKPVDDAFDFDLWARFSASYEYVDVGQGNNLFCPFGTLTDGLAQSGVDVNITLATQVDLDDVEIGSYAIINSEFVLVNSVDTTTKIVNISRAILDTTPVAHNAGDVVYFAGLHYVDVEEEYTSGDSPDSKLLTRTGNGTLDIDDATLESANAFDSRQIRPYPPGNLKFNGERFPSFISTGANGNKVAITWNHRDRTHVTQLNSMVLHTAANNYGPEAGATYTIKVYGEADTLGRTITSLSGTSYDYTEAFEISDFGTLQETLRFEIYAVRGGYNSWNDGYNVTVQRSMRGSVSASSSLIGDMAGYLEGVISAISGAGGDLDVIPLYRGRVDAVSSVGPANLNRIPLLVGSTGSSSGGTAFLTLNPDPADIMEFYTTGMSNSEEVVDNRWMAQTFTASDNYDLKHVILKLYRGASLPGIITVAIQDVNGVGKPVGPDLGFASESCDYLVEDSAGEEIVFHFDVPVSLINGTRYAIVLKSSAVAGASIYWLNDHAAASYGVGIQHTSINAGSSWTANIPKDLYFKTFKTPS